MISEYFFINFFSDFLCNFFISDFSYKFFISDFSYKFFLIFCVIFLFRLRLGVVGMIFDYVDFIGWGFPTP